MVYNAVECCNTAAVYSEMLKALPFGRAFGVLSRTADVLQHSTALYTIIAAMNYNIKLLIYNFARFLWSY